MGNEPIGVDPALVRDVRASLGRAMAANTTFFQHFYLVLFSRKREYEEKFDNVDMVHQYARLYSGVMKLIEYAESPRPDILHLVGSVHSRRHSDVKPNHYLDWIGALLTVLGKSDPQFDTRLSDAWITVLTPGIEYMKTVY